MKKYLLLIFLFTLLTFPVFSFADTCPDGTTKPTNGICLNVNYPAVNGVDLNEDQNLNQIAVWFYYFIIYVSGIAAFVSFVWAGFDWLTSAGNTSKIRDAKKRIEGSLLGLAIILMSYIIIQVINPELVIFKLPGLPGLPE
ncbi:hypothetical protein BWK69_00245 [Candidatus Parcubacteria bacterium A4]|nr:MAG: hypothetical protein BWK69_00245 [Candidatus Parcubacteria bacterium A4]